MHEKMQAGKFQLQFKRWDKCKRGKICWELASGEITMAELKALILQTLYRYYQSWVSLYVVFSLTTIAQAIGKHL